MPSNEQALVYSCSGCSNVAQLANDIAVLMDRTDVAEMSCIAGLGGDVKHLVKLAWSGRPILAIDGCPLACVKNTLARHQIDPTWHVELSRLGIKKRDHEACGDADFDKALQHVANLSNLIPVANLSAFGQTRGKG